MEMRNHIMTLRRLEAEVHNWTQRRRVETKRSAPVRILVELAAALHICDSRECIANTISIAGKNVNVELSQSPLRF
jgi:hypothetical protein